MTRGLLVLCLVLLTKAARAQEVHYSPEERLDSIDAELISTAPQSGDFASYALTDGTVIDALIAAIIKASRSGSCSIRASATTSWPIGDLPDNVRLKRGGPLMHLKPQAVDGIILHTESENFSTSGENAQDNDLIVIRDAGPRRNSTLTLSGCETPRSR